MQWLRQKADDLALRLAGWACSGAGHGPDGTRRVLVFKNLHPYPAEAVHWMDITHMFERWGATGAQSVPPGIISAACGWADWRAEVRYVQGGRKWRALYYNCEVPLRQEPPGISFKVPIASAVLHAADGEAMVDVTERVRRYHGPAMNWHGARLRACHVLPFDDQRTSAELYPALVVRDALGRTARCLGEDVVSF